MVTIVSSVTFSRGRCCASICHGILKRFSLLPHRAQCNNERIANWVSFRYNADYQILALMVVLKR